MARLKRNSTALETARLRLAGLKTITPGPNFGPTLDLDQYEQEVGEHNTLLGRYNDTLTLLDTLGNDLEASESQLRDKNKRILAATGALYGLNSNEYETVGGTRSSERKPNTKKKPNNS